MDKFHIVGPTRLAGRVQASGAKNAALPALAATLLTEEPTELHRVPRVRDIRTLCRLLGHLGMEVEERADDALVLRRVQPIEASADDAPYDLVKTMRASVLVLGPLLARYGHARVSLPGGCAIGVRPIDQHLKALEALGAEVHLNHGYVEARASRLVGPLPVRHGDGHRHGKRPDGRRPRRGHHGAGELRPRARGGRSGEPPDLDGSPHLRGRRGDDDHRRGARARRRRAHSIIADRIEGGTYLIGAAMTRGDVLLEGAQPADLAPLLDKLAEIGATVETGPEGIRVRCDGELRAADLETAPHPGFPTDLQAQYMALMTQAHGVAMIRETIFENRFQHAPELMRMGADIQMDGNSARVHGPTPLTGAGVMATDLRASACLVLAGVAAEGETVVDRIYHLERGYEHMELKLQSLGARVARWVVPAT